MHLSTHPTSYPTRYQEIAARLEQELRHHYRCGDYLPAEHQLAARYEVNRHTLRRAIDQLVERGWVQRNALATLNPTAFNQLVNGAAQGVAVYLEARGKLMLGGQLVTAAIMLT